MVPCVQDSSRQASQPVRFRRQFQRQGIRPSRDPRNTRILEETRQGAFA